MLSSREKQIFRLTITGSVVNLLLVIIKFIGGVIGRSSAMIADAVHSLSDFLTDVIVLIFVRISGKPQDEGHDYGHGKYETLASLIIGVALLLVGIDLCVENAILTTDALNGKVLPRPRMIALIVAAISIMSKEGLYRYTVLKGKSLNSTALIANAWHHRSDALSSIGTLIGIAGAMFLGEKWRILDPIAAVVVSALIIGVALRIIKPCIDELLERSLPQTTESDITELMLTTPGVCGMHRLRTRRIGSNIAIEAHLKMDGSQSLHDAHLIASEVERRLREKFGPETHVGLHMEPA